MMAQWTGARPRYFGSSEPCMFSAPRLGMSSHAAAEHVAVVEGKHEIRPRAAALGDAFEGVGILRRLHLEVDAPRADLLDAPEPAAARPDRRRA